MFGELRRIALTMRLRDYERLRISKIEEFA